MTQPEPPADQNDIIDRLLIPQGLDFEVNTEPGRFSARALVPLSSHPSANVIFFLNVYSQSNELSREQQESLRSRLDTTEAAFALLLVPESQVTPVGESEDTAEPDLNPDDLVFEVGYLDPDNEEILRNAVFLTAVRTELS